MDVGSIIVRFLADTEKLAAGIEEAKRLIGSVEDTAKGVGTAAEEGTANVAEAVKETASSAATAVQEEATAAKSAVEETASASAASFVDKLKGIGSSVIGFIGNFTNTIGTIQSFGTMVGGTLSTLLSASAQMEQNTKAFTTLTGSGQKATAMLQQLNSFAAQTPFQTQDIDTAAEKLLAVGMNSKAVIPDLTGIGDALSALGKTSSDQLDQVVVAFGKIQTEGKLSGGVMMELSRLGIPAWQALADATGKPIATLQKMVSSGLFPAKVATEDLRAGLEKMFGGGMATQATTFTGLMSTLKSNITLALAAATGPLLKMAEEGLTKLGDVLASPAFQQFAATVGQQIGGVLQRIAGGVMSQVVPAFQQLAPHIQQVATFLASQLLPPLGRLAEALAQSSGKIATLVGHFLDWGNKSGTTKGSLDLLGNTLKAVVEGMGKLIDGIASLVNWLSQASGPSQVVRDLLVGIGVAIAAIQIGTFLATVPALIAGFIAWGTAAWGAAVATIAATWPIIAIGAAIAIVVAGIILAIQHWGEITTFLQGVWNAFSSWFMSALGTVGAFFHTVWDGITKVFQDAVNVLISIGKIGFQLLLSATIGPLLAIVDGFKWLYNHNYYFKDAVDATVTWTKAAGAWLQDAWKNTTTWIGDRWNDLAKASAPVWKGISNTTQTATTATGNWITSAWNASSAFTVRIWNQIAGAIGAAWRTISGIIGGAWNTYIAGPLGGIWSRFTGWFGNLADQAIAWGANLIVSFGKGIVSALGSLGSSLGQAAGTVTKFLGFHSPPELGPASDADTWAPNLIKMYASGLQAGIPTMATASSHLAAPLRNTMTAPTGGGGGTSGKTMHVHVYLGGKEVVSQLMPMIYDETRAMTGWRPVA